MPINFSTLLKRINFRNEVKDIQKEDRNLENKSREESIFQTSSDVTASNNNSNIKEPPIQDLSVLFQLGLNAFSNNMPLVINVLTSQMLELFPDLAKKQSSLFDELDKQLDFNSEETNESSLETTDGGNVDIAKILTSPELSNLTSFQAYVMLNEYVLTKKRKKIKTGKKLDSVEKHIDELENNNSVEIIKNLQGLNKKSMEKIELVKEFYNTANSYHAEYSDILERIEINYAKDFKKALKDIISIHSYNLISAKKDAYGTLEQKNRLWHNSQFEFKVLNLLNVLTQFNQLSLKLDPQFQFNVTSMCQNFIDLMDGFDFKRIINNMLKKCSDPTLKAKMSNLILNTNLNLIREMPEKFFKNESDRENTLKKVLDTDPPAEHNVMRRYF